MERRCIHLIKIQNITRETFAPYGHVLDFSSDDHPAFEIIVREPDNPWRMAVFSPTAKTLKRIECHPTSLESFEPVRGVSILAVAARETPDEIAAFLLDKPVCLFKGIWHDVLPLSEDLLIRITENLDVTSEYHELAKPLSVALIG